MIGIRLIRNDRNFIFIFFFFDHVSWKFGMFGANEIEGWSRRAHNRKKRCEMCTEWSRYSNFSLCMRNSTEYIFHTNASSTHVLRWWIHVSVSRGGVTSAVVCIFQFPPLRNTSLISASCSSASRSRSRFLLFLFSCLLTQASTLRIHTILPS